MALKRDVTSNMPEPRKSIQQLAVSNIFKIFRDSDPTGSVLRTWFKHFDQDGNMLITFSEFCEGFTKLGHAGVNVVELFRDIDKDGSGELCLDEIDSHMASIWNTFQLWCVKSFESIRELLMTLSGGGQTMDKPTFVEGLQRCGWNMDFEEVMFDAMDTAGVGQLTNAHFKWFIHSKKQHDRKEQAKQRCLWEQNKRQKSKHKRMHALHSFKTLLTQRFSSMLRAWFRLIDADESMTVSKAELFTACGKLGWLGDCRALWQALDADDSGLTTLEELDLQAALQLAKIKLFFETKFGSASQAFKAFDRFNAKKLKCSEWVGSLKGHGYTSPGVADLFHAFDREGRKFIVEENILFLDRWRPPPHLICNPNERAATVFKDALLRVYHCHLKAWRQCLDKDGSNRVSWQEFCDAAEKVKFVGDLAGAWRFMDSDFSGFITLHEVDASSSNTLMNFKSWAEKEFGGVRAAFGVFDEDSSNDVSRKEFRRACRSFGFDGDCDSIFSAFDVDGQGTLSSSEVSFLDEWEVTADEIAEAQQEYYILQEANRQHSKVNEIRPYRTEGPGPGAYDIRHSMGKKANDPISRSAGACRIGSRKPWQKLKLVQDYQASKDIRPAGTDYDVPAAINKIMKRQPSCSFSTRTEPRFRNETKNMPSLVPGPGHYQSKVESDRGPKWSFAGRHLVVAHPLERDLFRKITREPPPRTMKVGLPGYQP